MTPNITAIGYIALNHTLEQYLKTIIAKMGLNFFYCAI